MGQSACSSAPGISSDFYRVGFAPANNTTGEYLNDERHTDQPRSGGNVGEFGRPQLVGRAA
jgi:hypothetical protein